MPYIRPPAPRGLRPPTRLVLPGFGVQGSPMTRVPQRPLPFAHIAPPYAPGPRARYWLDPRRRRAAMLALAQYGHVPYGSR